MAGAAGHGRRTDPASDPAAGGVAALRAIRAVTKGQADLAAALHRVRPDVPDRRDRALANEIPVVASAACGLPEHPFLWQIDEPDADALYACLSDLIASDAGKPARRAS